LISVFGSHMSDLEIESVSNCLKSQWIGFGQVVSAFEAEICKVRNFGNFVMLDSGSNSLFLALKLLRLKPGTEVILPAYTWMACANAVILAGLVPVFADVELSSMNISERTIRPVISEKTSCIMVVHFAGLPVDIEPIINLGYPVIEDAAHAIYSDYKGRACGSLGDIGVFSFDSVKNLAVGEGGGLTCKSSSSEAQARSLRYCGIKKSGFEQAIIDSENVNPKMWWEYELNEPFIKMLPTNISASIGLAQLQRRFELQNRRMEIWNSYQEGFKKLDLMNLPIDTRDYSFTHSYFTFAVRVPRRNELARYLLNKGIYTTVRYHPLNNYEQFNTQNNSKLINTEILNKTALSLPLHPRLTDEDVDTVIKNVIDFY
jgi:dTDP-4-amino-4,6-dideoxygalactose transaminase